MKGRLISLLSHPIRSCSALLTLTTACAVLSSCNDLPSPIGSEILVEPVSLRTVSSDSVPLLVSTANAQVPRALNDVGWFTGRFGTFEAKTFVNFLIPFIPLATSYQGITENDVTATLIIPTTPFIFGDTLRNQYNFRVVELLKAWTPFATVDTLRALEAAGETQLYGRTVGSLVSKPVIPPILQTQMRIPLDARMILSWLRADTAVQKIHGVAIVANAGASSIRQVNSSATGGAYIEVRLRRPNDASDDPFDTYTLREWFHASFVTNTAPVASSSLTIEPATARRARISVNLASIPSLSFIHRAELFLSLDPARSLASSRGIPDTLFLKIPSSGFLGNDTIPPAAGVRIPGTNNYVFGVRLSNYSSLALLVERLLLFPQKEQALLLQITQDLETPIFNQFGLRQDFTDKREVQDIGRLVFHDLNAPNRSERPRLVITYSLRQ